MPDDATTTPGLSEERVAEWKAMIADDTWKIVYVEPTVVALLLRDRDCLLAENERLKTILSQSASDTCETDTELERIFTTIVGKRQSDSYAVEPIEEMAKRVIARVKELEDVMSGVAHRLRSWSIRDGSRCMDDFADVLEAAILAPKKAPNG